jgi:hypothetical protein
VCCWLVGVWVMELAWRLSGESVDCCDLHESRGMMEEVWNLNVKHKYKY